MLNTEAREVVYNNEYLPMSTSWSETQSMSIDTIYSSIEWKTRYARNSKGEPYPFDLYERRMRKLGLLRSRAINSIAFVSNYEREIYETANLDEQKVIEIARRNHQKYFDMDGTTLLALNVPHIYNAESSGAYHCYGLAEITVYQWREYFYKKYGYIVDNPKIYKEMSKTWKLGSTKTFKEFVIMATGKKLSADALVKNITMPIDKLLTNAKQKIKRMQSVKPHKGPVKLNASIVMVHGKEVISNNKKSFEDMAEKYKIWLNKRV